jgi:hypothetical protein
MMFGRADVLGERVTVPRTLGEPTRDFVIVGVMHDTVVNGLTASREPLAYFPIPREGLPLGNYLLVKSRRDDHQVGELVASVAVDLDPTLPLAPARPLLSEAEYELATSRTYAEVLTLLGGIGLLLAAVGMYGLLAQAVGERRREFGVRLAIGAASRHIAALVFQQAAWIAALGVAGGVVLAWWGTELIITYLWGVTATDPRVYALTVAVLLAAVTLAAARPAWQATRVSPIETLRAE